MSKYTSKCIGCTSITDLKERALTVFGTKYCRFKLRGDDQRAPPRGIIVPLKHLNADQLLDNKEILLDIYRVKCIMTKICKEQFGMTRLNWAQLGNLDVDELGEPTFDDNYSHVHYHFMPTYKDEFTILDQKFKDDRFGKALNINPDFGYKKMVPSVELLKELKKIIQDCGVKMELLTKDQLIL